MKCYVWNCNQKAVVFVELTIPPYSRMPCCQRHADEFPKEYPRVKLEDEEKDKQELLESGDRILIRIYSNGSVRFKLKKKEANP
jgi:hypothetical protein